MSKPAADFPVQWSDPADAELFWFQDSMHFPLPVTPLNATMFQTAFAEGTTRAISQLSMPIDGLRTSVHHGYLYLGPIPVAPEEVERRFPVMQQITMEIGATVLDDWRKTFEPQVEAHAERILGYDYHRHSTQEVAAFVRTFHEALADAWDIHMRVNIPPMNAVFGMEEMLQEVAGPEAVTEARLLLQGFDNKSVEMGRALWALSRWARDADMADAVAAARVRNGAIELNGPKAGEFREHFAEFLDAYGWRSDVFAEFGHKSWREDPSTPLTQLKAYLRREDDQDPFAQHAIYAAEREARAAALEARLPEAVRPVFRGLLPLAQQYIPIAEDHNFTIDQRFTVVVREGTLRLGRKLVEDGALKDPEDVFFLTLDEIDRLAETGARSGLQEPVQQRRRDFVRQGKITPPVTLGTPPPADAPPDPLVTKFFGIGGPISSDPKLVTGQPASGGTVTGEAKVVLTLDQADKLQPGDILVCRMTMPAWTPLFGVAAAIVADTGGVLSHCAIVAREYGIPCVAATGNATTVIKDGMRLRVDGSTGRVQILEDRRR